MSEEEPELPAPLRARRSIRGRLALLLASAVLISAGTLLGCSYLVLRDRLREQAQERLRHGYRLRRERVAAVLQRQRLQLTRLTQQHRLRGELAADPAALPARIAPLLAEALEDEPDLRALAVTDPQGRVLCASDPTLLEWRLDADPRLRAGLEQPVWSFPAGRSPEQRLALAGPVLLDGRRLGAVVVWLDATPLAEALAPSQPAYATLRAWLVRDDGPAPDAFPTPAPAGLETRASAPAGSDPWFGDVDLPDGREVLTALGPAGHGDWRLLLTVDGEEAYAPVGQLGWVTLAVTAGLLLVAIPVAWLLARRLARPLLQLGHAAEALRRGEPPRGLIPAALLAREDELGALAAAFARMATRIERRRARLTQRVHGAARERERAELALRENEELFRAIFAGLSDALLVYDEGARRFVEVNPAALALYGYPREAWERLQPAELYVDPQAAEQDRRRVSAGERLEGTWRLARRQDGSSFPAEATVGQVHVHERRFSYALVRDVTVRQREEGERRRAEAAAEAASQAKSEFLASMSHEIRTPMNAILGLTELLQRASLEPEQAESLRLVRVSAEALLRLLNDILDLSKIEAGRLELERVPFSLRDVVTEAVQTYTASAVTKRLELAVRFAPAIPDRLRGDPDRLRQVLVNLVGNAVKFTDTGQVLVEVSGGPAAAGEVTTLRVAVQDSGPGIPVAEQARIFESFSQGRSALASARGGTGLGLAIVRRLVGLMGGEVSLASEPGQGSTFTITLRLEVCAPPVAEPLPEGLAGLPVLVVDDSATQRAILEELLASWGLAPGQAAGGEEALEELGRAARAGSPYRVVLVDHRMPDLDGLAVASRVRADPALGAPPIVVLSAGGAADEPEDGRRKGVARYLLKPAKPSELLRALERLLLGEDQPTGPAAGLPALETLPPDQRRRVLLVEDSPVNQRLVQLQLGQRGHHVEVAADGQRALALLAARRFDVVLMDVQLPGALDGLATTRAWREEEARLGRERVRIVATTAMALPGDAERCLEAGMDDHVSKPIPWRRLCEAVEQAPAAAPLAPAPAEGAGGSLDLDWPAALEQAGRRPELLGELLEVARDEWPRQLARLRDGAAAHDPDRVLRAAHALKSSTAVLGGRRAAQLAGQLEQQARAGEVDAAPAQAEELRLLVEQLQDLLVARLKDVPQPSG